MAVENSPIQAPGIGKNSKRHDLSGTPGLAGSDLQYGDVQKLEAGQAMMRQRQPATQVSPQAQAPQGPPAQGKMALPDPVDFAKRKLGGSMKTQGNAGTQIEFRDRKRWLPMLQRMAASPTSSGLLQRAYIERLSREMNAPLGGKPAVIRQREFDERLRNFGR